MSTPFGARTPYAGQVYAADRRMYAAPHGQRLIADESMGGPNFRYAVPTEGGDGPGYHDSPVTAYATRLDRFPGTTPDPMRTQTFPVRDMRPLPQYPPEHFYTGTHGRGTERLARHGVEFLDADGIEKNPSHGNGRAADPRWVPPPEPRLTNRLSPHNYVFTRPFDQDIERNFNGIHFSMADHRRKYPVLGMQPPPFRRNTYRADPAPWDTDRTDMPNPGAYVRPGPIVSYDIPPSGSNSWRLS
jgi:hypothetical protein